MPSRLVSTEKASESVKTPTQPVPDDLPSIVCTKWGSMLLEIQGELNLPPNKPEGLNEHEEKLFTKFAYPSLVAENERLVRDAVKFGRLEIEKDMNRATLYISTSQRLVGTVETIDPPLGLLKTDIDETGKCEFVDVESQTSGRCCCAGDVIDSTNVKRGCIGDRDLARASLAGQTYIRRPGSCLLCINIFTSIVPTMIFNRAAIYAMILAVAYAAPVAEAEAEPLPEANALPGWGWHRVNRNEVIFKREASPDAEAEAGWGWHRVSRNEVIFKREAESS
ncbi:hypothetical protein KL919_003178 [Ogataea angusta]|nr:hypothetical protein KL939_002853 [Ogataea angusta]KAG7859113.1 hypothetical protein KL919_003178 [Ogataea angusta]